MLRKVLTLQSFSITRRALSSKITSEVHDAKPFSQIPGMSALKLVARNLPGGKYYKKPMKEVQEMFHTEFGSIMRLPSVFGSPEIIYTFHAEDFETVSSSFFLKKILRSEIFVGF
jgi:hypothetical protein